MSHCTGIDRTLTRTSYSSSLGEPPLLECILVLISNYILIASPLLKSKLPSFLRSQVNQEVTMTDVARYLLLQTERDMTWTFEWIGIDVETFNDEHDQMSGALVWL